MNGIKSYIAWQAALISVCTCALLVGILISEGWTLYSKVKQCKQAGHVVVGGTLMVCPAYNIKESDKSIEPTKPTVPTEPVNPKGE